MKLNKRKGFTIVELVIVIAVIAILAAVLIPNISNLVKKANASADESLVRNLNTALSMDVERHQTMDAALEAALKNGGYDLTTIVTKNKDNKILWDSKNDCFVYLNGNTIKYLPNTQTEKNVEDVDYFEILNEMPTDMTNQKYSIYLAGESTIATVETNVGLDVGKNKVGEVKFANDNEVSVLINTNGGKLTVNAVKANVTHRGDASIVTIEAVAKESYHENGKVNEIKLKAGRVVVEAKAEVGSVLVTATTEGAVEVEVKDTASLGAVGATDGEIAKKLNTVVKSSDKTEIIATSVNNSDFAGGFGTEKAPYLIATAEQFAKVSNHAEVGTYFRQIADININRFIGKFAGTYDGGNHKIEYNYTGSATYSYIFYGIKGYSEFKNICVVMGGKGVSLLLQADFGTAYGATFDNITFDSTVGFVQVNTNNFGFVFIEALYTPENASTAYYSFKNITNNVNLQNDGTCTGFIIGSGPCLNSKAVLNYDNCINNGTIIGTSSVGFLYGNTAYIGSVASTESEFIINNCKNNAALLAIGSNQPKVAFALGLSELNEKYQNIVGGTFLNENYLSDKAFTVNQDGVEFSINTQDTAVSYKLAFKVAAIYMKKDGTAWTKDDAVKAEDKNEWDKIWDVSNGKRFLIDLPVNTDKTGKLSTEFKAYDKRSALAQGIQVTNYQNGYALVEKDNITYLVFDVAENVYINCTVQPIVYAYDANGTLKGIANAK